MPGDRRTPNERLRARRLQRGWSQQDLADAVIEMGNREGERNLGLTLDQVSRWERGLQHPKPPYTKLICLVFRATAQELGLYLDHNEANRSSGEGEETTERQDFLKLGLAAAAAPTGLASVQSGASAVGRGTFEHLEAVVVHLDRAYYTGPPAELFRMGRAYRTQVQEMIEGPPTLREGRELYVYAGGLSHELAWFAHDLGAQRTRTPSTPTATPTRPAMRSCAPGPWT
jgi:transcriptional regulator with XRE-family HTH domain